MRDPQRGLKGVGSGMGSFSRKIFLAWSVGFGDLDALSLLSGASLTVAHLEIGERLSRGMPRGMQKKSIIYHVDLFEYGQNCPPPLPLPKKEIYHVF